MMTSFFACVFAAILTLVAAESLHEARFSWSMDAMFMAAFEIAGSVACAIVAAFILAVLAAF